MRSFFQATARVIAFVLMALSTTATFAQDDEDRDPVNTNGLIVEATAGWDGVVDRTVPTPVSLLLSNNTETIIEGQLYLTNPLGKDEVYLGEMTLAPKSTRRFGTIRDLEDWFECFAELRSGDRVLWRNELPISTGSDFQSDENFVLLIDDSGRRLITQKKASTAAIVQAANSTGRSSTSGKDGREIRSLNAKSWQIPTHPAPLVPVQAIVFPEATPAKNLNKAQWRCLAEWVCEGGTVFFHSESKDVLEALTLKSPLTFELADGDEANPVRRMGLGEIREFSDPLFSSKGTETRQKIADHIRLLEGSRIRDIIAGVYVDPADYQTEAQLNRLYVAGLFGVYTLFIGLFALMLFRFSKRTVMIYTVTVVSAGCVAAGVLGGILRVSQGDLKFASVTQIGAGGAVQVARLNVQSSGGRNEDVAISGIAPDLQFTGESTEQRRYSWSGWDTGQANPPFDHQLNQLGADATDACQVKVLMTPWGRRQLHATDFKQGVTGFDINLNYTPADSDLGDAPVGTFNMTLKNPAGIEAKRCWVILGVTRYKEYSNTQLDNMYYYDQFGQPIFDSASPLVEEQMIDMYQRHSFTLPRPGKTLEQTFASQIRSARSDYDLDESVESGMFTFPKLGRAGTVQGWLFAVVNRSPIMNVDQARTEFVQHNELHLLVQEIPTVNLPDPSLFLGPKPPPPPTEDDGDMQESAQ